MARTKLKRFAQNAASENVIEPGKPSFETIKGNWNAFQFKNNNPIVLELGCGRGEYSIALAEKFPDKNIVGVDLKGARLWKGSTLANEKKLNNVAFLRTIIQNIEQFFEKDEVSEIWITFPDPRPKLSDEKRRMTSPRFLDLYRKILKPNGIIHLKTDNTPLFDYTLEVLKEEKINPELSTDNLYQSELYTDILTVKTTYEKMFTEKGENIKYVKFRLG